MDIKDLFAILAFIVVFKMITSARLRGRARGEEPEDQSAPADANEAVKIAPMHMPIRVRSADVRSERIVPEKLTVDSPASDEDEPTL